MNILDVVNGFEVNPILAFLYKNGYSVDVNYEKAIELYEGIDIDNPKRSLYLASFLEDLKVDTLMDILSKKEKKKRKYMKEIDNLKKENHQLKLKLKLKI